MVEIREARRDNEEKRTWHPLCRERKGQKEGSRRAFDHYSHSLILGCNVTGSAVLSTFGSETAMPRNSQMAHPDIMSAWAPTTTTDENDQSDAEFGFEVQIQGEFGAGP